MMVVGLRPVADSRERELALCRRDPSERGATGFSRGASVDRGRVARPTPSGRNRRQCCSSGPAISDSSGRGLSQPTRRSLRRVPVQRLGGVGRRGTAAGSPPPRCGRLTARLHPTLALAEKPGDADRQLGLGTRILPRAEIVLLESLFLPCPIGLISAPTAGMATSVATAEVILDLVSV